MRFASRQKDDVDLTPEESQFQHFAFSEQFTPAAHAALKARLERVMEQGDRRSDTWACLAHVCVDDQGVPKRGAQRLP